MEKLTSYKRVMKVLNLKMPDRIPMMELMINPQVINKIYPDMEYYDFIDKIGHDLVGPNLFFDGLGEKEWIDKEKKIFKDRWGVTRRFTTELIPVPLEGPIKTKKDLINYQPPDPSEEPLLNIIPELVERYKGKKATFIMGRDVWTGSYMLRGMENLLLDLEMNPDIVNELVNINKNYYKEVHRRALAMGIDIIHLVDDYAYKTAPLMAPRHFEKFIYPALKEMVQDIKKRGGYCMKHTDGNIWSIIDMIVDTGIDGLGPLEPGAEMDLALVKEKYGDKIAVVGNVDCDSIARRNTEEVKDEVLSLFKRVSPGGGHILASGNTIPSSANPDNFMTMVNTCKEYGTYPIKLT